MKKQIVTKFSIPNPCNMKWEEMNPIDENRKHCSSCDRVIVDFTRMSDGQLLDFFRKNKNACGKFAPHQLDREILADVERKNNPGWKNIFILPSLLFGMETFAQQNPVQQVVSPPQISTGKEIIPTNRNVEANDSIVVQGTVVDSTTQEPIAFANVLVIDSTNITNIMGCLTDTSGKFIFKIPRPDNPNALKLYVAMIGYAPFSEHIPFADSSNAISVNILAQQIFRGTVGDIIVVHTRRNRISYFFHRIFHGYWY